MDAGAAGFARAVQLIREDRAIDYQGASGPCEYDANGNIVAQLARFRVDGQFVDVEKFDCVSNRECPPIRRVSGK